MKAKVGQSSFPAVTGGRTPPQWSLPIPPLKWGAVISATASNLTIVQSPVLELRSVKPTQEHLPIPFLTRKPLLLAWLVGRQCFRSGQAYRHRTQFNSIDQHYDFAPKNQLKKDRVLPVTANQMVVKKKIRHRPRIFCNYSSPPGM